MNRLPVQTVSRPYPLLIALLLAVSTMAYACGGGGDTTQSTAVPSSGSSAAPTPSSGLPANFPSAPRATIGAQTELSGQTLVALTTPDAVEDVAAFYADALSKTPWLTGGRVNLPDQRTVLFSFANVDLPNVRGSVSIARDTGDKNTIISVTYSTNYGSPSP